MYESVARRSPRLTRPTQLTRPSLGELGEGRLVYGWFTDVYSTTLVNKEIPRVCVCVRVPCGQTLGHAAVFFSHVFRMTDPVDITATEAKLVLESQHGIHLRIVTGKKNKIRCIQRGVG